jgi:hypothetical protein
VALEVEFGTAGGRTWAVADEESLRVGSRGLRREAPWRTLTGGGLARTRSIEFEAMGPEAARVLPGLGRLAEVSRRMTDAHRLLVLAQARARGRPRLILIPVPFDDPNAEGLLTEWRTWAMAAPVALLLAVLAPPAVVTYRLAADGELSRFEPAGLGVLALWLAVAALFVSAVRRRLG